MCVSVLMIVLVSSRPGHVSHVTLLHSDVDVDADVVLVVLVLVLVCGRQCTIRSLS